MKPNFISLCIIWIFTICTSLHAQKPDRPTPFQPPSSEERKHYPPVPFPKQNLNPDPMIIGEQAVISDRGIQTSLLIDTSVMVPESRIIQGSPGSAVPINPSEDDFNLRAFSSMMVEQDINEFPARTASRLYMLDIGQCSGILIDAKHVLTAGHCVYSFENQEWAVVGDIAPAYDEGPDEFYGTSGIGAMLSWTGWTQNGLWEHDMAVIELLRPVGALTGWCGYGYDNSNVYFTNNTFHNYSYPGESPYDSQIMYYRNGDFDSTEPNILYHNNNSWEGQSGSGAPDGDHIAFSTLSHRETSGAYTGHTRMTSTKFADIQEFIAENTPDETDFVAMKATASHEEIATGEWLDQMYFHLYNNSSQSFTGNVSVDYYLSTDDYIGAGGDILLATYTTWVSNLDAKDGQWIVNDMLTQIPSDVPPGYYYIGMHVTNSDYYYLNNYTDYQDAFRITILCSEPETPELNEVGVITKCENEVVHLEPINPCVDCEVYWSTGHIGPYLTVGSAGVYNAFFVNSCGISSDVSLNVIVEEIPNPEEPFLLSSGPTTFCEEDYVELYVENVCQGCTVHWSTGETGESILVFESGTYAAYMGNVCFFSSYGEPIIVTVESEPSPTMIEASGPTALCNGETVQLSSDFVCDECDVLWSNGQSGAEITVSASGTYTAVVVSACGTSGVSNSITVTQMSSPEAPQISANGPTQLCTGQHVNLTATNVCNGCTVQWSNGLQGNTILVSSPGTYTATMSNACGQGAISNAILVTNAPPFVPMVQVNNACHLAAPNGSDYQWLLNGQEIPNANTQFWTATTDGYYTVRMKGTDGCEGTSSPVFANGCITAVVESIPGQSLRVYPNPAKDRISLEWSSAESLTDVRMILYTMQGRTVEEIWRADHLAGGSLIEVSLPALPSGMYMYNLVSKELRLPGYLVVVR